MLNVKKLIAKLLGSTTTSSEIATVQKYCKMRVVNINGNVSSSTIATLEAPLATSYGFGRYRHTDNKYYPALITISSSGQITALYLNNGASANISGGSLVGSLVYITA